MRKHIVFALLLLLVLSGCSNPGHPPAESVQEEQAEHGAETLYLYENDSRSLAIDHTGQIVLESTFGQMLLLYDGTNSVTGICVTGYSGTVADEWGWNQPEHVWCDIYDTTGQFLYRMPTTYASVSGNFITGYSTEDSKLKLYRFSDGELLYDDLQQFYDLLNGYYISLGDWDAPGFFIDPEGKYLWDLPEQYQIRGAADTYLIAEKDGLYGTLNLRGEEVIPFIYENLTLCNEQYLCGHRDGLYRIMEPDTGNEIFRWPYPIQQFFTDSAVVSTDSEDSSQMLISLDGTQLFDETFSWVSITDTDADGIADYLSSYDFNTGRSLFFRPDGTILLESNTQDENYSHLRDSLFLYRYSIWENDRWITNQFSVVDMETGTHKPISQQLDAYCTPYYDMNTGQPKFLSLDEPNELGWYRSTVYDLNGDVLLTDLQDLMYRGDDVLQAKIGFTSGLLRLDGTWLYQESSFSTLNDS